MTAPSGPLALDDALARITRNFRGATAHADEIQCECHWGSAEELASLKVPDVVLDPDLLRRTVWATDWADQASVLRRVLPQLAVAMAEGGVDDYDLPHLGEWIARGNWQQWPIDEAAAVGTFLEAWWVRSLTSPAALPAHQALTLCGGAAGTVGPWLAFWETLDHPLATQRLAELVDEWGLILLSDDLPWSTIDRKDEKLRELTAWLLTHAPGRLAGHDRLLNILNRLTITGPARWDDPDWPYPAAGWER
ncbi:hypothetical protein [Kribbella catacumbae]|uniref:hypothetical protein n=1 Tax=Kribbella catacumbae TaxID=460086 RepID=UPI000365C973|nr:hypothetical protein [Kribbella catacumbae]